MDWLLDQRRLQLRSDMRDFVAARIPRHAARLCDERDEYPHDLLAGLSELGVMGLTIPQEYGGRGGDVLDMMIVYEELSRALAVLAWVVGNIALYGNDIIYYNGSEEQKQAFLPRLAKGELKFAFALTEPNAGSDAANIGVRAVWGDGRWRIDGQKMFITGAGVSDYIVTMARTGEHRYKGITAFIVAVAAGGVSTAPIKKLGYHGSNTCAVNFDGVTVAPKDILGGEAGLNQGWGQMVRLLNSERLALSACALGIGQAALDDAVAFAREHYNLGGADGRHQGIEHQLVEMATELEAARRLAYHAGWMHLHGMECAKETSMAKFFASETAKKIALRGIDLMGREGAATAHDMQRYLRDVLILSIGGGTTQIQKNIVAKLL